jgi:hypothetical protein
MRVQALCWRQSPAQSRCSTRFGLSLGDSKIEWRAYLFRTALTLGCVGAALFYVQFRNERTLTLQSASSVLKAR